MSAARQAWETHPELLPRKTENGYNINQANPFEEHMPKYCLQAIGLLESVFKEKNGTPRQVHHSRLGSHACARQS
jgi:hypothetical protein